MVNSQQYPIDEGSVE